jgi:hypothetical protein
MCKPVNHPYLWYAWFVYTLVCLTFADSDLHRLQHATVLRFQHGFRPGTHINHQVQLRRYATFCSRFHLYPLHPSPAQLTMYVEYLAQNLRSAQSVKNYLSAISFLHRQQGLECDSLQSPQLTTMLRAINHTMRTPVFSKLPITVPILYKLVQLCQQLGTWGLILKVAFLFSFFGFFRQSNIAPRSATAFDPTRDTMRSDVQPSTTGLVVRLKWTKTRQGAHPPVFIPLPYIPGSPLCPTRAFQRMEAAFPARNRNTPLLIYYSPRRPTTIVTTRMLARQLHLLIQQLHLPPSTYTLHSFRQGGATLAHALNIPLDQIKSHGTWSSNSVWTYLNPAHSQKSTISRALSHAVQDPHIYK